MRAATILVLSTILTLMANALVHAEMYAYPDKKQSAKQQQRDKRECQAWATRQSGFDPSKAPATNRGLGGGAGGAAVGAARGAVGGEAAEGAARGAIRGRLLGAIRRRREERQEDSGAEGGTARGTRDDYDRAYSACLTGRGYTVK